MVDCIVEWARIQRTSMFCSEATIDTYFPVDVYQLHMALKPLKLILAPNIIQRWWKKTKINNLLADFFRQIMARTTDANGKRDFRFLSADRVAFMPFKELVARLFDKQTIQMYRVLFQRLHSQCVSVVLKKTELSYPDQDMRVCLSVRIFLTHYMIAFKPNNTFNNMGSRERDLFDASQRLSQAFEALFNTLYNDGNLRTMSEVCSMPDQLGFKLASEFVDSFQLYLIKFNAWKYKDLDLLWPRMRLALIVLRNTRLSLPPNEPNDSLVVQELDTQIQRVEAKLRRLVGPTKFQEIQASIQRSVRLVPNVSQSMNNFNFIPNVVGPDVNAHLTHELIVNPNFRVTHDILLASMRQYHVAEVMHVLNSLERVGVECSEDSSDSSNFLTAVQVLNMIVKILDELPHNSGPVFVDARLDMHETLDLSTVIERSEDRTLTKAEFLNTAAKVLTCLKRAPGVYWPDDIQSAEYPMPERLEQTFVLKHGFEFGRSVQNLLKRFIDAGHLAAIYALNRRLDDTVRVLSTFNQNYEKIKFKSLLDAGEVVLDDTIRWYQDTVTRTISLGIVIPIDARRSYVAMGYVLIISRDTNIMNAQDLPETVSLDLHRFRFYQRCFKHVLSTLITARVAIDFLDNMRGMNASQVIELVKDHFRVERAPVQDLVEGLTLERDQQNLLRQAIETANEVGHATYNRMRDALVFVVSHRLGLVDYFEDDLRDLRTMINPFLDAMQPDIERAIHANWDAHDEQYNAIMRNLEFVL